MAIFTVESLGVVKANPVFALFGVFLTGLSAVPAGAAGDGVRPYAKFGLNELVVADIEDLRRQIRRCWKVPAVTRKEDFDIHVRIELRPDGTVSIIKKFGTHGPVS